MGVSHPLSILSSTLHCHWSAVPLLLKLQVKPSSSSSVTLGKNYKNKRYTDVICERSCSPLSLQPMQRMVRWILRLQTVRWQCPWGFQRNAALCPCGWQNIHWIRSHWLWLLQQEWRPPDRSGCSRWNSGQRGRRLVQPNLTITNYNTSECRKLWILFEVLVLRLELIRFD